MVGLLFLITRSYFILNASRPLYRVLDGCTYAARAHHSVASVP